MKFEDYSTVLSEAKFRQSPKQLVEQVKQIASNYISNYNSNRVDINQLIETEKVVSFKENKQYRKYFKHFGLKKMPEYFTPSHNLLGKATVTDLETNETKEIDVYCVYGDTGETDFAAYSPLYQSINLYDETLKDLPQRAVETKILHELTHGFQQYKGQSDKMRQINSKKIPFDWPTYYKEPIEIDTHLNEIAYSINQKHRELLKGIMNSKELYTKKLLQMRLKTFLKELKVFINTPLEAYTELEELPLPSWTETLEEFLKTIKTNSRLWNKFKQKMVRLYNDLYRKTNRVLNTYKKSPSEEGL